MGSTMFTIGPLRILNEFDEDRFKREGILAHPPIRGPTGEYFGHEWSRWRHDTLDDGVDRWLAERGRACAILDIGCATGVRAVRFAEAGHRVTAVDIVDPAGRDAPSSIAFVHADIRTLAASRLNPPFDLVHARRVINFLTLDDLDRFFGLSRDVLVADGILALSLFTIDVLPARLQERSPPGTRPPLPLAPGLVAHHFTEVHDLMHRHGLTIIEAFSDHRVEVGVLARLHRGIPLLPLREKGAQRRMRGLRSRTAPHPSCAHGSIHLFPQEEKGTAICVNWRAKSRGRDAYNDNLRCCCGSPGRRTCVVPRRNARSPAKLARREMPPL